METSTLLWGAVPASALPCSVRQQMRDEMIQEKRREKKHRSRLKKIEKHYRAEKQATSFLEQIQRSDLLLARHPSCIPVLRLRMGWDACICMPQEKPHGRVVILSSRGCHNEKKNWECPIRPTMAVGG